MRGKLDCHQELAFLIFMVAEFDMNFDWNFYTGLHFRASVIEHWEQSHGSGSTQVSNSTSMQVSRLNKLLGIFKFVSSVVDSYDVEDSWEGIYAGLDQIIHQVQVEVASAGNAWWVMGQISLSHQTFRMLTTPFHNISFTILSLVMIW